ncbi:MAG: hypothetical protein U0R52_11515 [Solirubrobacterales bacterium]
MSQVTVESIRREATAACTCARCEMTVRWMPGSEPADLPANWSRENGQAFCLSCRRARAAEAGLADASERVTLAERAQIRATALIEFELTRDPARPNGTIARACRSSVPAVVKARRRLGLADHTA